MLLSSLDSTIRTILSHSVRFIIACTVWIGVTVNKWLHFVRIYPCRLQLKKDSNVATSSVKSPSGAGSHDSSE